MKKKIIFWAFTTIANLQSIEAQSFKAMSFNIRYDEPDDSLQNWNYRKAFVGNIIRFYDVDIVGLQEVLVQQRNDLQRMLPGYQGIGVGREDGKEGGEFAAIFFKPDLFRVIRCGTFWLSQTPEKVSIGWDADVPRIVTWAIFADQQSGRELAFFNTHFARGVQTKARNEGAKVLLAKIKDIAADRDVVVTGDFNSTPESEPVRIITESESVINLIDSKCKAEIIYGPQYTSHGFGRVSAESGKIIDYVFVLQKMKVKRHGILAEMLNSTYSSDHYPILVEMEFSEK